MTVLTVVRHYTVPWMTVLTVVRHYTVPWMTVLTVVRHYTVPWMTVLTVCAALHCTMDDCTKLARTGPIQNGVVGKVPFRAWFWKAPIISVETS